MRQVEAQVAHTSCAKDTVYPSGSSPRPPTHYAPNMPAPQPHPEMGGIGEASDSSDVESGFPTHVPENGVSSCYFLPSPCSCPGLAGYFQNTRFPSGAHSRTTRWGTPQVEEPRQRKRRGAQGYSTSEWPCRIQSAFGQRDTISGHCQAMTHLVGPEVRMWMPVGAATTEPSAIGDIWVTTQLGGRQGLCPPTGSHWGTPRPLRQSRGLPATRS